MDYINFEHFKKLVLKIGEIREVIDHPNADKLYLIKVDIGNSEIRTIVAGIKDFYKDKTALVGKQVVIVTNLEPREIRGIKSEGMLLAAKDNDNLSIITTEKHLSLGSIVS